MYDADYFFVQNPLNRYTLSPGPLKFNGDGSLDLYIQNDLPARTRKPTGCPRPEGKFVLMLRLYWPKESLINGTWKIPPVKRVD